MRKCLLNILEMEREDRGKVVSSSKYVSPTWQLCHRIVSAFPVFVPSILPSTTRIPAWPGAPVSGLHRGGLEGGQGRKMS